MTTQIPELSAVHTYALEHIVLESADTHNIRYLYETS